METITIIAGLALAIFLIVKFNRVLTVSVAVINTTVELADKSVKDYAHDVDINLAKKRLEQKTELEAMSYIPTHDEIASLLKGRTDEPEPTA